MGKKERMLRGDGSVGAGGGGLEDLANAAVDAGAGPGGGRDGGEVGLDPTWLTRYGYLTALGQGMFKTK